MTDEVTRQLGFKPALQEDLDSVEKIVFFVGTCHVGADILASLLDAHPSVVIADRHLTFQACSGSQLEQQSVFHNKLSLFNEVYKSSYFSSLCGNRSFNGLKMKGSFNQQESFKHHKVIGDQSSQALSQLIKTPSSRKCFFEILRTLAVPVVLVHVVRNPYDIIASDILRAMSTNVGVKPPGEKIKPKKELVMSAAQKMLRQVADEYVLLNSGQEVPFQMLKIKIEDCIMDPETTARKICGTLGITCTQEYIQLFQETAFANVASDRYLIEWDASSLQHLETIIRKIPTFQGYTFEEDILAS